MIFEASLVEFSTHPTRNNLSLFPGFLAIRNLHRFHGPSCPNLETLSVVCPIRVLNSLGAQHLSQSLLRIKNLSNPTPSSFVLSSLHNDYNQTQCDKLTTIHSSILSPQDLSHSFPKNPFLFG